MTRPKTKPRLGWEHPGFNVTRDFNRADATRFAEAIGVTHPARVAKLQELLNDRAGLYRGDIAGMKGPTASAQKAALEALRDGLKNAVEIADALDERSRWHLRGLYERGRQRFPYEEEAAIITGEMMRARDVRHARRLLYNVSDAIKTVRVSKGRRSIDPLRRYALALARVYEAFSGEAFVLGNKMKGARHGGAWVESVIRHVAPDVPAATMRTALEYALANIRHDRQAAGTERGETAPTATARKKAASRPRRPSPRKNARAGTSDAPTLEAVLAMPTEDFEAWMRDPKNARAWKRWLRGGRTVAEK